MVYSKIRGMAACPNSMTSQTTITVVLYQTTRTKKVESSSESTANLLTSLTDSWKRRLIAHRPPILSRKRNHRLLIVSWRTIIREEWIFQRARATYSERISRWFKEVVKAKMTLSSSHLSIWTLSCLRGKTLKGRASRGTLFHRFLSWLSRMSI